MFIGSTLGRIAVTRARAEAVIAQLDSRLKSSERELRTGAADRDRTAALTDECASLVGIARGWGADYFPNFGAGGGELDVDMQQPDNDPVENIYFAKARPGNYRAFIRNYTGYSPKSWRATLRAEVEGVRLKARTLRPALRL